MKFFTTWTVALIVLLLSSRVWAFPEMVRHGYVNCTACHTSLVGGNMLNPYGRSLSREILSQKMFFGQAAGEGDEQYLHGLIETPKWLDVGGDIRLLQTFVESQQASKGRFLIMQVEMDFVARASDLISTFFSLGRLEPRKEDPTAKDFVYSPRWGGDLRLSPQDQPEQTNFRVGRFMPAYGINFAEHVFVTRTLLDFGPGQERFAAELSWVDDQSSVIGTLIGGQASGNQSKYEVGGIIQFARAVGEKSKVGINYYKTKRRENDVDFNRSILGGFAYMGFTKDWYGLFEVDQPRGADEKNGLVEAFKLGHEVFQGLHIFATHEFANLNTEQADPKFEAYGIGAEWFPKPHFDFYGAYRKEKNSGLSADFQDVVWLIGHYYL
jgi:hypothetical protein